MMNIEGEIHIRSENKTVIDIYIIYDSWALEANW